MAELGKHSRIANEREVMAIRTEFAQGRLDVRAWADVLDCSMETVRRIARRDTYRHMVAADAQAVPVAHGAALTEQDIQASLEALAARTPLVVDTAAGVDKLLDQLAKKGREDGQGE